MNRYTVVGSYDGLPGPYCRVVTADTIETAVIAGYMQADHPVIITGVVQGEREVWDTDPLPQRFGRPERMRQLAEKAAALYRSDCAVMPEWCGANLLDRFFLDENVPAAKLVEWIYDAEDETGALSGLSLRASGEPNADEADLILSVAGSSQADAPTSRLCVILSVRLSTYVGEPGLRQLLREICEAAAVLDRDCAWGAGR